MTLPTFVYLRRVVGALTRAKISVYILRGGSLFIVVDSGGADRSAPRPWHAALRAKVYRSTAVRNAQSIVRQCVYHWHIRSRDTTVNTG